MKTLKKTLCVVLAVVMAVGTLAITASATDFADDADITYKEAVEVLTSLGVLDGTDNNRFDPEGTLTRAQGAKIVAYVALGADSDLLRATSDPFDDVRASSWMAGAVAYCVEQGIIAGVGNNNFDPDGTLTGVAFAKMLLEAIGVEGEFENTTAWDTNVVLAARNADLDADLVSFSFYDAITREEAAQMALNALFYTETGTTVYTVTVNGVTHTFTNAADAYFYATSNNANVVISEGNNGSIAKDVFNLSRTTGTVGTFGRPSTTYTRIVGGVSRTIGNYAATPDLTYTTGVRGSKIYSDLGLTGTPSVVAVVNGAQTTAIGTNGATVAANNNGTIGGNGILTEVYLSNDGTTVTLVQVQYKLAYVENVVSYAATALKGAYTRYTIVPVKLENNVYVADTTSRTTYDVYSSVVNAVQDVDTADITGTIAKDQYVLIVTDTTANVGTTYIMPAATVSGAMSGGTSSSYVIGGTSYNVSDIPVSLTGNTTAEAVFNSALYSATRSTNFAVDMYGNVIAPISTTVVNTYVYVAHAVDAWSLAGSSLVPSVTAYVVDTAGNLTTMNVSNIGGKTVDGSAAENGTNYDNLPAGLYTYTVQPNGTYRFDAALTSNTISTGFNYAENPYIVEDVVMGNANTVFYTVNYTNGTPVSVTRTTGMSNMGVVASATGSYIASNGVATYVFLNNATAAAADQVVYYLGSFSYDTTGAVQYDVISAGQRTTLKSVLGFVRPGLYTISNNNATAVSADSYEDGAATYLATDSMFTLTNNGGLLYVTTTTISTGQTTTAYVAPIASTVPVYVISASTGNCTTGTAADLSAVANASVVVLTANASNGIGAIYAVVA